MFVSRHDSTGGEHKSLQKHINSTMFNTPSEPPVVLVVNFIILF